MKTTYNINLRTLFVILIMLVAIIGSPKPAAAKLYRVAVVPFKINAEKDLSFLRDGIADMLTSRLAWEDRVTVLTREEAVKVLKTVTSPLNESKARQIGGRLKVDYVLFGSLTVFGNSVSIDAKMVDVSGSKPPLTFFNQSQGMDQVIPGINLFATDINAKVFGRDMPARQAYAQPQTSQEQTSVRAHPEKLIAQGFGDIDNPDRLESAPGPAFMAAAGTSKHAAQFWKSQSIKKRIEGIAIGDINQDGKKETVIVTSHSVEAYRSEKNRFLKIKTLAEHRSNNYIGVDVADINGNGTPEIFISSLNPLRNAVNSFVLEFNGQTYIEIVKKSPWYYRVVDHPARGKILLGQRHTGATPSSGKIFEMAWQNSGYEPANRVMRTKRANVLGFALGDAMNEGAEVAVAFDDLDYLKVYDLNGKEIWKSGDRSGGSPRYYDLGATGPQDMENHAYYPARTLLWDIDRDGKKEVVTVNNERFSKLMELRKFTNAKIEVRAWDGIGLAVRWRTRKLSGYFSDFAIGDFDNDGKDELVATLVIKPGSTVATKPKSTVIAYELQ